MGRDLFPKVIPQLDGIRGIAILLVLGSHAEGYRLIDLSGWAKSGWWGVDLFFVLSGFLITGILADAKGSHRYFRNFYGRRVLRILPVYFLVLALSYLLMRGNVLPETAQAFPWAPYLLIIQNVFFSTAGFHALGATWSLAVEEHFYLVWPWLMRKAEGVSLMPALVLVLTLSPIARLVAWGTDVSYFMLYKHTLLRLDGLAMGALLALWIRHRSFTVAGLRKLAVGALGVGIPLAAWMLWKEDQVPLFSVLNKTPVSLLSLGLVSLALLASRDGGWIARLLALAPLRFAGRISYCLYLVHIPVLDMVTARPMQMALAGSGVARNLLTLGIFLTGSVGLATLSWYGFERPILRLKRHFGDEENAAPARAASASV